MFRFSQVVSLSPLDIRFRVSKSEPTARADNGYKPTILGPLWLPLRFFLRLGIGEKNWAAPWPWLRVLTPNQRSPIRRHRGIIHLQRRLKIQTGRLSI